MASPFTSSTVTLAFFASIDTALFSSKRVIAVNLSLSKRLDWEAAIIQFVLHGLPTTTILQSSAAFSAIALPCPTKILPLSFNKSERSIPGPRGLLPTNRQRFASLKASAESEVTIISSNRGNAQSSSSIATPFNASNAGGISKSCKEIFLSKPNISPAAILGSKL